VRKSVFVLRFLASFALLIAAGAALSAPTHYARALTMAARVTSPAINGWWLEERPATSGSKLWFRAGTAELRLLLSLESLSLGILPFLALLAATPGLAVRRWIFAALIGIAAFFLLDLVVVLLYPILVSRPNAVTDITGTFLGLLTFVGAPIILWFALTYDRLRSVWRLG
jgi:hypothetical protein